MCSSDLLMKKKEAQYQNEFLIEDAERVHHFLNEVQEVQKEGRINGQKDSRKRMKKEVMQYNCLMLKDFERDWNERFAKTVEELESIENTLESKHE